MKTKTKWVVSAVAALLVLLIALVTAVPSELDDAQITPEPSPDEMGQGMCPAGEASGGMGPQMVRLPEGFCIDTTEVTRAQYDRWTATSPSTAGQPSACVDNADFAPGCDRSESEPVVCVDWCDAHAYCEAAGKRLCGRIGDGGPYELDGYADPTVSEWHAACTSGGANEYTYGNTLDTQICRGADAADYTTWGVVDVGTLAQCHSPDPDYAAVYDLSGNAAEWDNSCEGDAPEAGCRIRGGSFEFNDVGLRCAMAQGLRWPRMRRVVSVGFRCCAN